MKNKPSREFWVYFFKPTPANIIALLIAIFALVTKILP